MAADEASSGSSHGDSADADGFLGRFDFFG